MKKKLSNINKTIQLISRFFSLSSWTYFLYKVSFYRSLTWNRRNECNWFRRELTYQFRTVVSK